MPHLTESVYNNKRETGFLISRAGSKSVLSPSNYATLNKLLNLVETKEIVIRGSNTW